MAFSMKEFQFSCIPNLRYHLAEAIKSYVAGNLEWDDVGLSWENKIEWGQTKWFHVVDST